MQIKGEKGIGSKIKIILQICLCGGIVALIALPFILAKFDIQIGTSIVIIYPNGIALLIIVYKFVQLFDTLKKSNPFCEENVKILKEAGVISLIESILWIIDILIEYVAIKSEEIIFILAATFFVLLFLGVGIALYILSELFKEAVKYKEENELTI